MAEIIYREESFVIMGACFEVYNRTGPGFPEAIYQECMEIEMEYRKIPFVAQAQVSIDYRDRTLRKIFQPDFICYSRIVLEIKAVSELNNEARSQVHSYLKATGYRLGLLVNFGHVPNLEYERIVRWQGFHFLWLPNRPEANPSVFPLPDSYNSSHSW